MGSAVDDLARQRLRALRQHSNLSLDELARRSGVGASTISRLETGQRSMSLDVLVPLARELGVSVDSLVTTEHDENVIIRPQPDDWGGMIVWPLSRPGSNPAAYKMQLEPTNEVPEQRVHPGNDWIFVLEGSACLHLGDRTYIVRTGESAQFSTMTPHALSAVGGTASVIGLFDHNAERVHRADTATS